MLLMYSQIDQRTENNGFHVFVFQPFHFEAWEISARGVLIACYPTSHCISPVDWLSFHSYGISNGLHILRISHWLVECIFHRLADWVRANYATMPQIVFICRAHPLVDAPKMHIFQLMMMGEEWLIDKYVGTDAYFYELAFFQICCQHLQKTGLLSIYKTGCRCTKSVLLKS